MTSDSTPPEDSNTSSRSMGGGAPLALSIMAGVVIGGLMGEPSIGLFAGIAVGIVIAVLIWRAGTRK
ncbi:MAG TPA: hypothetical protein VL918_13260 [Sphingobium sp.]|nr:hypothetical protein [Sphingobium sp.]